MEDKETCNECNGNKLSANCDIASIEVPENFMADRLGVDQIRSSTIPTFAETPPVPTPRFQRRAMGERPSAGPSGAFYLADVSAGGLLGFAALSGAGIVTGRKPESAFSPISTLAETDAGQVMSLVRVQDAEPTPPAEPASGEDCDEWAARYLEWLRNNGELKEDDVIVVRCGNKTYEFRRRDGGDEWDWVAEIHDVRTDAEDAIEEQLGHPYPSGEDWHDPNDPDDFDEYWSDPTQSAERDDEGNIVRKILGTPENCGLLKLRLVEPFQLTLTRTFELERDYVVADENGVAKAEQIQSLRAEQQTVFLEQLAMVAGTPANSDSPGAEPAWPTKDELLTRVKEGSLLTRIIARKYCRCEDPCKMRQQVVGILGISIAVAPEAPMGSDRPERRVAATTTAGAPVKVGNYWKVKIRSRGTVIINVTGDVVLDVWCES